MKGALLPAYIEVAGGKQTLGWRHLLLPYMEEQALFNRIDQSKAWNDPANVSAAATQLSIIQCPSCRAGPTTTQYVAVIGPQTAWPGATGHKFQEFSDGLASTILVIESHGRSANWAAPSDLTFDEAVELLSKPVPANDGHEMYNGFFYKKSRGRSLVLADTSVKYIAHPLDRRLAAALLTVAGGEQISLTELEKAGNPQLDYAKCYSFGAFVTLAIVPAAWTRRNVPRAAKNGDA